MCINNLLWSEDMLEPHKTISGSTWNQIIHYYTRPAYLTQSGVLRPQRVSQINHNTT